MSDADVQERTTMLGWYKAPPVQPQLPGMEIWRDRFRRCFEALCRAQEEDALQEHVMHAIPVVDLTAHGRGLICDELNRFAEHGETVVGLFLGIQASPLGDGRPVPTLFVVAVRDRATEDVPPNERPPL